MELLKGEVQMDINKLDEEIERKFNELQNLTENFFGFSIRQEVDYPHLLHSVL